MQTLAGRRAGVYCWQGVFEGFYGDARHERVVPHDKTTRPQAQYQLLLLEGVVVEVKQLSQQNC